MTAADMGYWHRRASLPGCFTLWRPGNDCLIALQPLRLLTDAEKAAAEGALGLALKRLSATGNARLRSSDDLLPRVDPVRE
jgi:hypothetical protein